MNINWQVILGFINLVLIVGTGSLLWYQIRSNHEWNRRKATNDLFTETILGSVANIRHELEKKINPYDKSQTYDTMKDKLTPEDIQLLRDLLNYLEQMCLAIKHGIIDEDIAFDCAENLIPAYWRWAEPFIKTWRIHSPRVWIEIENQVNLWKKQEEKLITKIITPGKGHL